MTDRWVEIIALVVVVVAVFVVVNELSN